MKKRILAIAIALSLILLLPAPALAYEPWDVEDPCVADNEDFAWALGYNDGGSKYWEYIPVEYNAGALSQATPSGKNVYRDEGSGEGWLDKVVTWFDMSTYSGEDAFYFAQEPGGYNLPPRAEAHNRYKGLSGVFWVEVFNFSGFDTYKWDEWGSFDRVLAEDVVAFNRVNGLICTLYIPEGTHLSFPSRPYTLVTNLFVEKDDGGGIYFSPGNVDFSQECALKCDHTGGTEEVVTFTQIRDGLPVE